MLRTKRVYPREYRAVFQTKNGEVRILKGYVCRDVCVYRQSSFDGQMRRHGSDRAQRCAHAALDAVASRPVSYAGPGVLRRRPAKVG